ncbi:MAG: M20/M25/M40 family metallo-hydrolase [Pseudomonadota bacterium]
MAKIFEKGVGVLGLLVLTACGGGEHSLAKPSFDAEAALALAEALSADDMAGRGAGTSESAAARALLIERFEALGLVAPEGGYEHPFVYGPFRRPAEGMDAVPDKPGVNLIAKVKGRSASDLTMVVTAHYDHLGIQGGEIFNGADDNASGVAAALAVAEHFTVHPPEHDVLVILFDAEEDGFGGARAFIADLDEERRARYAFNLNLDMVSRGDNNKLWASGASHWPALKPLIEQTAAEAPVDLQMGYDSGDGRDDWTMLSDHMVFFRAGIPHLYLGVEDHPDYHRPSDDFANVDQDWFVKSMTTIVSLAEAADAALPEIAAMKEADE